MQLDTACKTRESTNKSDPSQIEGGNSMVEYNDLRFHELCSLSVYENDHTAMKD